MKRKIDRQQSLPPFACDAPSLDALIVELTRHFGDNDLRIQIDIKLPSQELSFASVDELMGHCNLLPDSAQQVWIFMNQWKSDAWRQLIVTSYNGDSPSVTVRSDDVGWAAGATEIVRDFALRHKRWYAPLRPWLIWLIGVLLGILPAGLKYTNLTNGMRGGLEVAIWLLGCALIWSVFLRYKQLFPAFELLIRPKSSWPKKYFNEITVIAAVITAMAAIIALFLK